MLRTHCLVGSVLLISLLLLGCDDPTVETELGTVQGKLTGDVYEFLGIPFAKPPTGENRWRPPVAMEPWAGTRLATGFKPGCPQDSIVSGVLIASEDCLYLNVTRPADTSGPLLPVIFWLYGGNLITGSNYEHQYNPNVLTLVSDAVVVAPNYRLGLLGDLALPELAEEDEYLSNNLFLLDQLMALEWVRDNIESFGGDPNNVTIMGSSAGAGSSCWHIASPLSKGLFHKAIVQSGNCAWDVDEMDYAFEKGEDFADATGCTGEDRLACMRSKTHKELLTAVESIYGKLMPFNVPVLQRSPAVDDYFFLENPIEALKRGNQSDVSVLMGVNHDEGTFFTYFKPVPTNEAEYLELLIDTFGENADLVAEYYPSEDFPSYASAVAEIRGDSRFVCLAIKTMDALDEGGHDVYSYYFTHDELPGIVPGLLTILGNGLGLPPGTFHGSEVPYVFGIDSVLGILRGDGITVSDTIMDYWQTFIHTGTPNNGYLPFWPSYTVGSPTYMELKLEPETGSDLKPEVCELWNEVM